MGGCIITATWRHRKPFSQWRHSFQMKAVQPLAKMHATVSRRCSNINPRNATLSSHHTARMSTNNSAWPQQAASTITMPLRARTRPIPTQIYYGMSKHFAQFVRKYFFYVFHFWKRKQRYLYHRDIDKYAQIVLFLLYNYWQVNVEITSSLL